MNNVRLYNQSLNVCIIHEICKTFFPCILIYCNTATSGLTNICMTPEGARSPREGVDISEYVAVLLMNYSQFVTGM